MRLIRLRGKLNEIFKLAPFRIMVFEEAGFSRFGNPTRVAAEIRGLLTLWCEDNHVEYKTYKPTEIKKFAVGKGRASKAVMLEAAKSRLNYEGHDTDTADALWVLELAKENLNGN